MIELRPQHALGALLKGARLARSTFYYQARVQEADDRYAHLKARIGAIYVRHKGRYGYRRITDELRNAGSAVGLTGFLCQVH